MYQNSTSERPYALCILDMEGRLPKEYGQSDESEGKEKFLRNVIFLVMFTPAKKTLLKPLGSNVENGFGVIFLHANEIIMSALSGYQKQAFISSRDVVGFAL